MALRAMIDEKGSLPVSRRCELIGLNRSTLYYLPTGETAQNLYLMKLIDEIYISCPYFGSRKIVAALCRRGEMINRKRVQRLMRQMGIEAIYSKPRTSIRRIGHKVYPYLLKGLVIDKPDQVWCTDITYIPMQSGFMYLVAVMDWYSRFVIAWEISNTMESQFCCETLNTALSSGRKPEIFNTDQGAQFTDKKFVSILEKADIKVSMDGRGRFYDNIFIERLWRSVKYEEIYLNEYLSGEQLYHNLDRYFKRYNEERPHQALGYKFPCELYCA